MRIGLTVPTPPDNPDLETLLEVMERVDALGLHAEWMPYVSPRGFNATTALALGGARTRRIELGTFVVPTFRRSGGDRLLGRPVHAAGGGCRAHAGAPRHGGPCRAALSRRDPRVTGPDRIDHGSMAQLGAQWQFPMPTSSERSSPPLTITPRMNPTPGA
jgi:hypothetical protein